MSSRTLSNVEPSRFTRSRTIIVAGVMVCALGMPSAQAQATNDSHGAIQVVRALHIRSVALNQRYHLPRQHKQSQARREGSVSTARTYDSPCPCNADLPHRPVTAAPMVPCPCNAGLPNSATHADSNAGRRRSRRHVSVFTASALSARAPERAKSGRITFGRFDPVLDDYSIWAANPDGSDQQRLTNIPSFMSDWSPDGSRIAFDFNDGGEEHIATMTPTGHDVRQLTFGSTIQEIPKWSPDGRWITFDASPTSPADPAFSTSIWIMRSDGSNAQQVTHDGFDVEPVFSPDGSQIAFARLTGTSPHGNQLSAIYVVNADGTQLHQIVAALPGLEHPDWSPDGRWISFNIAPEAADAPAPGSVMALHPNGSGLRILRKSTNQFGFFKPVWSPNGRKLLTGCHDTQAHIDKLCILDAHARNVEVIIDDTPNAVNYPAWGTRPTNP